MAGNILDQYLCLRRITEQPVTTEKECSRTAWTSAEEEEVLGNGQKGNEDNPSTRYDCNGYLSSYIARAMRLSLLLQGASSKRIHS